MAKQESIAVVEAFDPFTNDAGVNVSGTTFYSAQHDIGEGIFLADGRVFRYTQAGGTIAAGNLACSAAPVANLQAMVVAAQTIGTTVISVTPGGSITITANQFSEGYLGTVAAAGGNPGVMFKVKGNPVQTSSSAAFNVTLFDPINVALTASDTVSLIQNRYQLPTTTTTQTRFPAGVPLVATALSNYCWLQSKGRAMVLMNGTPAVGNFVVVGASTAGSVDVASSTWSTAQATMFVGKIEVTGVSTNYYPVYLQID